MNENSYSQLLKSLSVEAELYEKLPNLGVRCFACGHKCKIPNGKSGVCKIRFNELGKLLSPYGYVCSINPDPIEKKPFFHVAPGSLTLSFGMLGCDLKCSFCQNWDISQVFRDPNAEGRISKISSQQIVETARFYNSKIITSTYNEPLITSEWAKEIFSEAKKFNIQGAYVSNGNASVEVLDYLKPFVKYFKVDLKSFNESNYRKLGGKLKTVLDTIEYLYNNGFWVEIVTLLIPDYNDSNKEITDIANFIKDISNNIPWHITAFHPNYKMNDVRYTSPKELLRAVKIGYDSGLNYVYAGNIPGGTKNFENTYCHQCKTLLVERTGFRVTNNLLLNNSCPKCSATIPGYWEV
jgi:pyruvate formate lyase activating enzyme